MNKAWLLLLLLPLLLLTSCTDKDEDYPNFMEPLISPERDFYLVVQNRTDIFNDSNYQDLYLRVVCKELCQTLKLNGHSFPRDSYTYDLSNKYYTVNFDAGDDDWMILDENERNLSYEIILPNRSISGTIKFPAPIAVSFPEYNPLQNYSLNWTTPENPGFFTNGLSLSDVDDNDISASGRLGKDIRSYTWNKEIWKDLAALRWVYVDLAAHNYKYEHKGMVWVMRSKEKSSSHYSRARKPFACFEQFMRGELELPDQK